MSSVNSSHDLEDAPLLAPSPAVSPVPPHRRGFVAVLAAPVVSFWEFLVGGNFVQLAVAFVVGGAFNNSVRSLIDDLIMPPIGYLLGSASLTNLYLLIKPGASWITTNSYATLAAAQADGAVTWGYGRFMLTIFNFLVVALIMYFVVKAGKATAERTKSLKKILQQNEAPSTKECPFCCNSIPIRAKKCGYCCEKLE